MEFNEIAPHIVIAVRIAEMLDIYVKRQTALKTLDLSDYNNV